MLRRSLVKSVPALAVAPLLTASTSMFGQMAHAGESGYGGGKKVYLHDVTGKASAYVKKGYYFKKYDHLKFKDEIEIYKFYFYGYQLFVEGRISKVYFESYYGPPPYGLYIESAYFKAPATLRKEKKDGWSWDDGGKSRRRPPHEYDYDLYLDIGRFKVIQTDDEGGYGKGRREKKVVVYLLDPDEQKLYIEDKWLKKYLEDHADDDYDYDHGPDSEVYLK